MAVETMRDLYQDFNNIIGVKDATSRIERVSEQGENVAKILYSFLVMIVQH